MTGTQSGCVVRITLGAQPSRLRKVEAVYRTFFKLLRRYWAGAPEADQACQSAE